MSIPTTAFAMPQPAERKKAILTLRDLIKVDAKRRGWDHDTFDRRTDVYRLDEQTLVLHWSSAYTERALCGYSLFGPCNALIERNYRMGCPGDVRRRLAGLSF